MSDKPKLAGEYLRPHKFVLESRWADTVLAFELWVNHRSRTAVVIWHNIDSKHVGRIDYGPANVVRFVGDAPDYCWLTDVLLGLLADIGKAYRLAFPAVGPCYPDVLVRAFDKLAEVYPPVAWDVNGEK